MGFELHSRINNVMWPWFPSLRTSVLIIGLLAFGGCKANEVEATANGTTEERVTAGNSEDARMWMTVGDRRFAITLADSATAKAFAAQFPLALDMDELNGNEKHADVAKPLPTKASRPGTLRRGDLMLYGASTVVVFYQSFQSSYSYTRLGQVDDSTGLADAVGRGSIRIIFSAD